jgi:hypothetical protein
MTEPITNLEDAVRAMGALPMPVGTEPRTLDRVEDELTGARLSLYEEELLTERLRLAWQSARVWRRELRLSLQWATASRERWRSACIAAEEARDALQARVDELEAASRVDNEALDAAAEALRDRSEGEHYAVVHHDYRQGRDLPETGGAR